MTKEQINPSRSTIRRLYNIRPTAASHGISSLQLLLLLSTALPFAIAQEGTESSDDPYGLEANFNPSMAVIISVFVCAFFIIGFFSVYLRQCTEASAAAAAGREVGDGRSRVFVGGLKPAVIQNFPVFIYSAVKDLKIGKGALECAVCLNEFEDDDSLRLLPKCDHVFHPDCIDAWLVSHSTCPVCRANLVPESGEFVGDATQTLDSYDLPVEQNPRLELSESQNQVSINVNEDQSRDSQSVEIVSTNQTPKQNWAPGSTARGGISGKFPRSHSTGHSLVQPGESLERYTLRLPEEVRRQIVMSKKLKRTTSCGVVLPREGSSRRGWRKGGEGSSRGKGYSDRYVGRFDRGGRSDRWVFSMAPPFLSRVASIPPPKSGGDGDVTPASSNNAKTFLTSVMGPLDCLAVKAEGTEQSSGRPPV